MARKTAPAPPPEEYADEPELLPPPPHEANGSNEIDLKVQRVEEQLLDLRRQQEEIERQKRELDELSRKRREFDEGRRDIVEKLTRGLVLLEREEAEVQRELEQIKIVRDNFAEHLGQTENINPADWTSEEIPPRLTQALARVDQAKSIYSQARARLLALRQGEEGTASVDDLVPELQPPVGSSGPKSFGTMVRESFAYSVLPLSILGFFLIIAYVLLHH
jgi:hypothetical protein